MVCCETKRLAAAPTETADGYFAVASGQVTHVIGYSVKIRSNLGGRQRRNRLAHAIVAAELGCTTAARGCAGKQVRRNCYVAGLGQLIGDSTHPIRESKNL